MAFFPRFFLSFPFLMIAAATGLSQSLFPSVAFARESKLQVVFLVDDNSAFVGADITPGCLAGVNLFKKVLAETFRDKDDRYKVTTLQGSYLYYSNLVTFVRDELELGSEDTLWFHYCGHGASDSETGHYFATSKDDIDRSDLLGVLQSRSPRLVVLTSDACSSPGNFQFPVPRRSPASWEVFSQLFFSHRGTTNITAATEPQFGWINSQRGGFFGQALAILFCEDLDTVDYNRDGFVDWEEGGRFLTSKTQEIFDDARANALERDPSALITKFYEQTPSVFATAERDNPSDGNLFRSKFLRVTNSTDDYLTLTGRFQAYYSEGWAIVPSKSSNYTFKIAPGKSTYLADSLNQKMQVDEFTYSAKAGQWDFKTRTSNTTDPAGYRSKTHKTYDLVLNAAPAIDGVTVRTTHNIQRYGRKGMLIQLSFVARRLLYLKCKVNALFYFSSGEAVKNLDDDYGASNGTAGVSATFMPIYLHTQYNFDEDDSIEMFMPYDELHLKEGIKHQLYFKLHMNQEDEQIFTSTTKNSFYYEK